MYLHFCVHTRAHTHTHTHTHTQSLHGRQDERVLHELKEWNNNFISVQDFMDDLAVAKGRIRSIQEEVQSNDGLLSKNESFHCIMIYDSTDGANT